MRSEALPSHNSGLTAVLVAPDIAFSTASRMWRQLLATRRFVPQVRVKVVAIPGNKAADAFLDGCGGSEPDVAHEVIHIRIGGRNIAGLHRQKAFLRCFPKALLDHLDEMHQFHRVVVADVVELVGRLACARVGLFAAPRRIRGRHPVGNTHHTFDDVVELAST